MSNTKVTYEVKRISTLSHSREIMSGYYRCSFCGENTNCIAFEDICKPITEITLCKDCLERLAKGGFI